MGTVRCRNNSLQSCTLPRFQLFQNCHFTFCLFWSFFSVFTFFFLSLFSSFPSCLLAFAVSHFAFEPINLFLLLFFLPCLHLLLLWAIATHMGFIFSALLFFFSLRHLIFQIPLYLKCCLFNLFYFYSFSFVLPFSNKKILFVTFLCLYSIIFGTRYILPTKFLCLEESLVAKSRAQIFELGPAADQVFWPFFLRPQ